MTSIPLYTNVRLPDGRVGMAWHERWERGKRQIEVSIPAEWFWHGWYDESELRSVDETPVVEQRRLM